MFGRRHYAGFVAAEDFITVAGDAVIDEIAQGFGKYAREDGDEAPETAKLFQDEKRGVGAVEERFVRLIEIDHNVKSIEVCGIFFVAGENVGGQIALQRGEAEDALRVAAENELIEAVAESADAVVEDEWGGHNSTESLMGRGVQAGGQFAVRWIVVQAGKGWVAVNVDEMFVVTVEGNFQILQSCFFSIQA
jgi:hypothetical protein